MSGSLIKFGVWKEELSAFHIERDDLYEGTSVKISKRKPEDTFNRVVVRWTDVSKAFGYSYVTVNDAVDQRITGIVRKKAYNLIGLVNGTLATKTAYRLLAESMYRYKIYTFRLSYRSMLLEVGDVGLLSDGFQIYREKIRIIKMTEDQNGKALDIEAIEEKTYLYLSPIQGTAGILHSRYEYPALVSPNTYFTEDRLNPIVNLHICPQDENFNGFVVYFSLDGTTYEFASTCAVGTDSCNIDGVSVTTLPYHPAVIHKSKESLTLTQNISFAAVESITDSQFFNNINLLKLSNEVLAYKTVTSSSGNYIATNLIRGLFNTEAAAHSISEIWHTLKIDFKFNYTVGNIGQIIYFKVLTYFGPNIQQLADVAPVTYIIGGEYLKPVPLSILRLKDREGFSDFVTADFEVDFNLGSKISGYNVGTMSTQIWNNFVVDDNIKYLKAVVKDNLDTILSQVVFDLQGYITDYNILIEEADYTPETAIKIEITPESSLPADARSIIVVDRVP
jgi:hypothetical protein